MLTVIPYFGMLYLKKIMTIAGTIYRQMVPVKSAHRMFPAVPTFAPFKL